MDNRDKDKMSRKTEDSNVSDVNRETSRRRSEESGDSSAEFGKNIGRSEDLENEPSRRGSMGSSGTGATGSKGSNSQIDEPSRNRSSKNEH